MSKKSRKRNRRLLKALGVGLAIAGLGRAFSNRKTGANVDSGKGGDSSSAKSRLKANTISGTNYPGENVNEFKEVVVSTPNTIQDSQVLSRMRGKGDEGGFSGQEKRRNYITRTRDAQNAAMMRALRSNNAYRGNMMTSPNSILEGVPLEDYQISAKKGGRIVKGKKTAIRTGAAKRGFGRAFKGGKR